MKKLLLFATMLLSASVADAQEVLDHFKVGPYEVDYRGKGDVNYRIRKDVDIRKFFNIENDTIVEYIQPETQPIESAVQVSAVYTMPLFTAGKTNSFAIEAAWKKHLSGVMYFNAGLMLGMQVGEYENCNLSENLLEIGMPLSLEFSRIERGRSSVYATVGVMPTYYTTAKAEYLDATRKNEAVELEKPSGLMVAPRLELGAYVPVADQLLRFGFCLQMDLNCSNKDYDQFKLHSGDNYIGFNVGLVF